MQTFIAAFSIFCANCVGGEWYKLHRAVASMEHVLPSRCFANSMRGQGVSEHWINALATSKRPIDVEFYFENNRVVGWTNPDSDNLIRLNRKFHDGFGICMQASNLAHEVLHLEGFRHFVDAAYATNQAFAGCCRD